ERALLVLAVVLAGKLIARDASREFVNAMKRTEIDGAVEVDFAVARIALQINFEHAALADRERRAPSAAFFVHRNAGEFAARAVVRRARIAPFSGPRTDERGCLIRQYFFFGNDKRSRE